jgi:NADH-quinone oxidoreductase subunit N
VIAAFFYIRVIVAMFMDEEPEAQEASAPLASTTGISFALSVSAAAILAFGILPGALIGLAGQAASFAG